MPEYTVMWSVHISGDDPLDAAQQSLRMLRDERSTALIFLVADDSGEVTAVDLYQWGLSLFPLSS